MYQPGTTVTVCPDPPAVAPTDDVTRTADGTMTGIVARFIEHAGLVVIESGSWVIAVDPSTIKVA